MAATIAAAAVFALALLGWLTPLAAPWANDGAPGRSLGIASVPNLRDLGGYPTGDGMVVRTGLMYRSDQLARISAGDLEKMAALGLKHDYDLRTAAEREALPDELPPGVTIVWLNVLADSDQIAPARLGKLLRNPDEANARLGGGKAEAAFTQAYRSFVSLPSAQTAYRRLFREIAKHENLPALVHCTTGKDRTGWAAAALLSLLGVAEEVIFDDFLRSNEYILPAYRKTIDAFTGAGGDPAITRAILGVNPEYLKASFDEIRLRYGTVEDYFSNALLVDAAGQETLRRGLLVAAPAHEQGERPR